MHTWTEEWLPVGEIRRVRGCTMVWINSITMINKSDRNSIVRVRQWAAKEFARRPLQKKRSEKQTKEISRFFSQVQSIDFLPDYWREFDWIEMIFDINLERLSSKVIFDIQQPITIWYLISEFFSITNSCHLILTWYSIISRNCWKRRREIKQSDNQIHLKKDEVFLSRRSSEHSGKIPSSLPLSR